MVAYEQNPGRGWSGLLPSTSLLAQTRVSYWHSHLTLFNCEHTQLANEKSLQEA